MATADATIDVTVNERHTRTNAAIPHRLIALAASLPWMMDPRILAVMQEILTMRAAGYVFTDDEIASRIQARRAPFIRARGSKGDVAVLPVYGPIFNRARFLGDISSPPGTSAEQLTRDFRAAMDDKAVRSIVLDVDSPGGTVNGVPELAREIAAARGSKRVVASVNATAASAAYYLASAAQEIAVTPSGEVGSIGVWTMHEDHSAELAAAGIDATIVSAGKYKTEGNFLAPLGDEARAELQRTVDHYYAMFTADVAKFRGTNANAVRSGFGEGRMVEAERAVDLGMADRVATFDQTLTRLGSAPAVSANATDDASAIRAERNTKTMAAGLDLVAREFGLSSEDDADDARERL